MAWAAAASVRAGAGAVHFHVRGADREQSLEAADVASALKSADEMIAVLDRAAIKAPRLLHSSNAAAWGVIDAAARRGYDTRAGLEDVLTLPDGAIAPDNAAIVAEAGRRVEQSRPPV